MTRHRIEVLIYTVGLFVLGLVYYQLKGAMSRPVFFGVMVAYLLVVRFVGYLVSRRVGKEPPEDASGDA